MSDTETLIQKTDAAIAKAREIGMTIDEFLEGTQDKAYRGYVKAKWLLMDRKHEQEAR